MREMDAVSQAEARLLAAERTRNAIERDIEQLRQRVTAVSQSLWDAWSEVRVPEQPTPTSTPTPTPNLTLSACPALTLSTNLPFTDSIYGSGTLVWDGVAFWKACLSGLAYRGGFGCAAATIAIQYYMDTNGNLGMSWYSSNTLTGCPSNSTCSSAVNVTATSTANVTCCGNPPKIVFTPTGSYAPVIRYPSSNQTVTVTLATTVPSGVAQVNLCGGLCVLANLPFTDSVVGSGTLVWNGTIGSYTYSGQWVACLPYAYPGYAADGCSAVSTCVLYRLTPSGQLIVNWLASGATGCPETASCATIVTTGNTTKTPSLTGSNCSAKPATATFSMGTTAPEIALRTGASAQTITISLPTS